MKDGRIPPALSAVLQTQQRESVLLIGNVATFEENQLEFRTSHLDGESGHRPIMLVMQPLDAISISVTECYLVIELLKLNIESDLIGIEDGP